MITEKSIQIKIATILRKIGSKRCLEKAEALEQESSSMSALHLRDLELNLSDIQSIITCLKQERDSKHHQLKSISFSYNHLFGDSGAIALTKNLPETISEIGLVNCGISDAGGIELLNWMKNSTSLQMICIEQNNFSEKLRSEFKEFSSKNPSVLVVF